MFLAFALTLLASVDLGGSWQVTGEGLSGTAQLPGTLLDAGLGHPADKPVFGSLTPKCTYVGKATYERTVELDADFVRDGRLSLERVRWRSRVWWDGAELSSETSDSLNAPHVYQVPKSLLTRGRHRVSIEVDNSMIHPIGMKGASYSDCAQAVWTQPSRPRAPANWRNGSPPAVRTSSMWTRALRGAMRRTMPPRRRRWTRCSAAPCDRVSFRSCRILRLRNTKGDQ